MTGHALGRQKQRLQDLSDVEQIGGVSFEGKGRRWVMRKRTSGDTSSVSCGSLNSGVVNKLRALGVAGEDDLSVGAASRSLRS